MNKKYKIAIVSKELSEPCEKLLRAAELLGVSVDFIEVPIVPIANFQKNSLIKKITQYDAIYYRVGLRGVIIEELSKILHEKNIPCINYSQEFTHLHEKIRQILIADRFGIPQPKSIYTEKEDYEALVKNLGSPFVVKPNEGSHGAEVTLIKSFSDFKKFNKNKTKDRYCYQEYIDGAEEYRVYTLGGKAVATYKKESEDNFRKNLHLGGSIVKTEEHVEKELEKFGEKIAQIFKVDVAGIDILYKNNNFLFLELNLQPGWRCVEDITGVNFAEETIKFLFEKTHSSKSLLGRMLSK